MTECANGSFKCRIGIKKKFRANMSIDDFSAWQRPSSRCKCGVVIDYSAKKRVLPHLHMSYCDYLVLLIQKLFEELIELFFYAGIHNLVEKKAQNRSHILPRLLNGSRGLSVVSCSGLGFQLLRKSSCWGPGGRVAR